MLTLIIAIFVLGYLCIAFEHSLKVNKTASALLTGVLVWTIFATFTPPQVILDSEHFHEFKAHLVKLEPQLLEVSSLKEIYAKFIQSSLREHLGAIAEILFFLLGAMTIVELVDAHQGFKVITNRIKTRNTQTLLWIISIISFFLSAVLDNLTTAIVMVSLIRRLIHDQNQRLIFAAMIVIAANAGGAWSPIGDVTTTMLWIGGQISALAIMKGVFLPSLACLLVPLLYFSFHLKGEVLRAPYDYQAAEEIEHVKGSKLFFFVGVGALLFVPIFKTITHLPPYIGMLLGLGIVWVVSEILHINTEDEEKKPYTAVHALSRIDTSSVLFFLGILIAISCLESTHLLSALASYMNETIGNLDVIAIAIGLASAIVDNVPLVAATMGMYDLATYPMDSKLWVFLAYTAGTGGSILIIGSAAGVAVMGMEKIDFMWYLRKISFPAALGYFAGAGVYLLMWS